MRKCKKIETLEELKRHCTGIVGEFFIQLKFGLRSSKDIIFHPQTGKFSVFNYIDGSRRTVWEGEMMGNDNLRGIRERAVRYVAG